jgi:hypothetical protein
MVYCTESRWSGRVSARIGLGFALQYHPALRVRKLLRERPIA